MASSRVEAWRCDCGTLIEVVEGSTQPTCAGSVTLGTAHGPRPMRRVVLFELAPDVVERMALALYEADGGDVRVFPWPCARAGHYRKLARAALPKVEAARG